MLQSQTCRHDYYTSQIERMGGFCEGCVWGYKAEQTCGVYVEHAMREDGLHWYNAVLKAMRKESCRGGSNNGGSNKGGTTAKKHAR